LGIVLVGLDVDRVLFWLSATVITFFVIRSWLRDPERELTHPKVPLFVSLWLTAIASLVWVVVAIFVAWIQELRQSPPT
jgi:hypothetical protein